ncbi:MAG: glycosyltransferase family 4 protein [Bryobacteraceae bacterium]
MKILALTAGAARMYCGSCLRDNTLAAELGRQGHEAVLLPLYTPIRTDEPDVSYPKVFLNGISVCLDQQAAFFRKPRLLDRLWDARWMLKLASRTSLEVDPHLLGDMTVSMLRGEDGFQFKEIRKLKEWLRGEAPPEIATLPNSLLIGLARPIREAVNRPVCCMLQGEELFLDQLREPYRTRSVELIRGALDDVDGFAAVSQFSAGYWRERLGIPERKMHVIPLGISLEGYDGGERAPKSAFNVGFFARVAPEKGLHLLVESYLRLRRETDFGGSTLQAAGYLAPEHRKYLRGIERRMREAGLAHEFRYHGELDRGRKIEYLASLDLVSVPSAYDEPKGIFLLEAMAAGAAVVQPRRGAFPEILEKTGGGILVEPDDAQSLADGIYGLWKAPERLAELRRRGAEGVRAHYGASQMAARAVEVFRGIVTAATHA